jgi:hypothetical protein
MEKVTNSLIKMVSRSWKSELEIEFAPASWSEREKRREISSVHTIWEGENRVDNSQKKNWGIWQELV